MGVFSLRKPSNDEDPLPALYQDSWGDIFGRPAPSPILPLDEHRVMQASVTDPAQFAQIYELYFDRIYAYCLRRVYSAPNPHAEAEDLASLIFTRALRSLDQFRNGSVRAWLFQIAHHAVVNYYRDRKHNVSLDVAMDQGSTQLHVADETLNTLIKEEAQEKLMHWIRELSDSQQNLIWMRISGELTSEEIGQVVGKRAGAVRMELNRLIKQLRVRFEQEFGS